MAAAGNMTLLSYEGDFRAFKALIAAQYVGVSINQPAGFQLGKDNTTPEFLAKSPLGKTPVLETPSGSLFESNAIARYVARLRRDVELTGASFYEAGLVDAWLDFVSHQLEVPASMWVFPVLGYTDFSAPVHIKAVQELHKALEALERHLKLRTYLVGHRVTLADIVAVCALLYPMKLVLSPEHRSQYPSVQRWFTTCVNQKAFKAVVGDVPLCEKEILAPGNKGVKVPSAAQQQAGKAKKAAKKEQPKKKAAEKPKEAAAGAGAAAPAPKPKKKGLFDDVPPTTMDIDEFKRMYSNAPTDAKGDKDYYAAVNEFFKTVYDPKGYSLWLCTYNYNSENKRDFMTSNLVGGFVQRSDAIRKYAFGTMHVLNNEAPYEIAGVWMLRGDSIQPMLESNPDAEYYTWKKLDGSDPEVQKYVTDYWCAYETVDGKAIYDSKVFK